MPITQMLIQTTKHLKFIELLGCILLTLMVFFPTSLQVPKALLLVFILSSLVLKGGKYRFEKHTFSWIVIYLLSNLCVLFVSIFNSNPAALRELNVMLLWPILFYYFSQCISKDYLSHIFKLFEYYQFFICLAGLIAFVIFNTVGTWNVLFFKLLLKPGFPFCGLSGAVIVSFMFLYFFNLSVAILSKRKTKLQILNVVLGFLFILMTARRSLMLNIPLALLVVFFFARYSAKYKKEIFKKVVILAIVMFGLFFVIFVYATTFVEFTLDDFSMLITSAFENEAIGDSTPRKDQAEALFEGFWEHPILGSGVGVDVKVSRSIHPGMYELTYHAMLFQRGVVGTFIYFALYFVLNFWCVKSMRYSEIDDKYTISYLVSLTLFMIANATNPYLAAYDFLWIMFFGFIFINQSDMFKNGNNSSNQSV